MPKLHYMDQSSVTAPGGSWIVLVEDDPDVRSLMIRIQEGQGHRVTAAGTGQDALAILGKSTSPPPSLLLLDISLPDVDGLEVLSQVRRTGYLPVILVTGRQGLDERVQGLEMGADDYIVKPFANRELVARVGSVLRLARNAGQRNGRLEHGGLVIDTEARQVTVDGQVVPLTPREYVLLAFLASAPYRTFTRSQLLEQVWGSSDQWQDAATVTEHVRRIRLKVEPDASSPWWVKTVRGVGYRFDPDGDPRAVGTGARAVGPNA